MGRTCLPDWASAPINTPSLFHPLGTLTLGKSSRDEILPGLALMNNSLFFWLMGGRRLDGDLLTEPDRLLVGVVRGVDGMRHGWR